MNITSSSFTLLLYNVPLKRFPRIGILPNKGTLRVSFKIFILDKSCNCYHLPISLPAQQWKIA